MFVEVADTLVGEFDLIEFLHRLTTHSSPAGGIATLIIAAHVRE